MAETKRDLLIRLTGKPMHLVLGHGAYSKVTRLFSVPDNTFFIFICKASRGLPQAIVNDDFYKLFRTTRAIQRMIRYPQVRVPDFMEDWRFRTYGPGDQCPDLQLSFNDPEWPGMGSHFLPLRIYDHLRIIKGGGNGLETKMSDVRPNSGIMFIVACRGVEESTPNSVNNIKKNYVFPRGSLEAAIQMQNRISYRFFKRRRENTSLRKNKNVPLAKRGRNLLRRY